MKLFSVLALTDCSLALTGCMKDNTSGEDLYPVSDRGQVGGGISGSSCRAASTQMVDTSPSPNPCPSTSGKWTLNVEGYMNGTLTGNKVYCGLPVSDVFESQADWDSYVRAKGNGETPNQDYQAGSTCASMSYEDNGLTLFYIYTKAR